MTTSNTPISINDMELDKHYAFVSAEGFRTYMGAYTGYLAHGPSSANMFFIRPGHNTVNFLFRLDTKFYETSPPASVSAG